MPYAAVVAAEEGMEVWRRQVLAEAAKHCAEREAVLKDWESRVEAGRCTRVVQVDHAWFQRLKPNYDEKIFSNFALNFNSRRYMEGERDELFRKTERSEKEARCATDALEAKGKAVQDAADAAAAAHADARSRTSANERQDQAGGSTNNKHITDVESPPPPPCASVRACTLKVSQEQARTRHMMNKPSSRVYMGYHPEGQSRGYVRYWFKCLFSMTLLPGTLGSQGEGGPSRLRDCVSDWRARRAGGAVRGLDEPGRGGAHGSRGRHRQRGRRATAVGRTWP